MVGGFEKGVFVLALFLLVPFIINAQPISSTYQYSIPDYNEMPEMYREVVNEVTSDKIYYELNPNDIYINETGNYSEIVLEDFFYTHNFGMPMLPIKYFEIPIPSDAKTFSIKIVNSTYTKINVNKKIKPFVPEEHDFFDMFPKYEIYDEYFSSPEVITVDFGYRGKQKYALVRYYPFGYDSKSGKLNITTSAILKIEYDGKKYLGEKTLQGVRKILTTEETLSNGQTPDVEWEKTFGGSDYDRGHSVQQTTDGDGGYIIVGVTASYGLGGDTDVYLIKTDSNGNMQWNKTYGDSRGDWGNSVQQTTDGGYIIVGSTYSYGLGNTDVYLIKTDSNGNMQWNKTFGGSNFDEGYSVQQTTDEGYIIVGNTESYGSGYYDVYLIKTDSNGNMQWSKTYGGPTRDDGYSVQQTTDGGYIIVGYTDSYSGNVYLIKTDSNGNMQWNKTYGGPRYDVGYFVEQTTDEGYIIVGYTDSYGSVGDVYLIKTDSNGNMQWNKTYGGSNNDIGTSVEQTTDGGYITVGYTYSYGSGDCDVYLIKLNGTCLNGIKDGGETDIDCGDSCPKCSDGKTCLIDSDCQSNYCNARVCETFLDLSIDSLDISFSKIGNKVNISTIIKNSGKSLANNVEVKFLDTYNNNLIKETTINIGSIPAKSSKPASINWDLEENHIVYVIIDPNNKIKESDKSNNNAYKEYTGTLKYYVETDVPPSMASSEIEDYVKENIKDGVIVDNSNDADVKVLIARHNPLIMWHFALLEEEGCGFYGGTTVKFNGKDCNKPYCGVICDIIKDGKKEVYIEANDVDGFIAASKKFIEEQDSFKTTENNGLFLDEENEDAIAVYDYLHTSENLPHYKENNEEFRQITSKALNGEMYKEEQINTTADGVILRLLHLKPSFSDKFVDYKDKLKIPVVLARGLWSNLYEWKDFGEELSNDEGRDTWLIEITGGPGQDCDSCPNYNFDDLTDSYVPALLNKVLNESGKDKLQYVGFSNGCRTALSSLEKGSFDPNKVETFVGVGCPGAFEGTSLFADCLLKHGEDIQQYFEAEGITNISQNRFSQKLAEESSVLSSCYLLSQFMGEGDGNISRALSKKYLEWIQSSDDQQPGTNLYFNKFSLIYGYDGFGLNNDNDYIVTERDESEIYDNINANDKLLYGLSYRHNQLPNKKAVKKIIKEEVNKE